MVHRKTLAFTGALVVVLCSPILRAQSTNASIMGRVTDPSEALIVGAKIAAISMDTSFRYEAVTNGSGEYYITNPPPGNYRIEIEKTGFKKLVKPDVTLHVQDAIELNFELTLGSMSETITVEAGAPLVNTESGTVSTVIDHTFVDNLPLNGRSFQTLIMLTPGVVVTQTAFDNQGQWPTRRCQLLHGRRCQRQFRRHRLWHTGANCRRSAAGVERFRWDKQSCLGGCHAGVSHSNVIVRSRVRTHARRTDFDCNSLGNESLSWHAIRIFQKQHSRCQRLVCRLESSSKTCGTPE